MKVYFSDIFDVSPDTIEKYGAFNVSLINDLPLFIDPFLVSKYQSVPNPPNLLCPVSWVQSSKKCLLYAVILYNPNAFAKALGFRQS